MNWQLTGSDGHFEIQGEYAHTGGEPRTCTERVALVRFASLHDARIMAAGEDLFEACRGLLRELDFLVEEGTLTIDGMVGNPSIIRANAAIAKATGKTL